MYLIVCDRGYNNNNILNRGTHYMYPDNHTKTGQCILQQGRTVLDT